MPLLLVDNNEATTAPEVLKQLRDYFGPASVVSVVLPVADLAVALPEGKGILRIERKTPEDFTASVADGRLARQVDGMVKSGAWSAVVVTGHFDYEQNSDLLCINGKTTGWHGTSIRAAIRAVQWAGGLVEFCAPGHYARTVDELYKFSSKPSHAQYHPANRKHKPLIDFFPDETTVQERVEFLMGLPGVGSKMARSLLDWCGSRDHTTIGTLAEALSWITLFPDMERGGLPDSWSPKKSIAARDFLMGQVEGVLITQEKGEQHD